MMCISSAPSLWHLLWTNKLHARSPWIRLLLSSFIDTITQLMLTGHLFTLPCRFYGQQSLETPSLGCCRASSGTAMTITMAAMTRMPLEKFQATTLNLVKFINLTEGGGHTATLCSISSISVEKTAPHATKCLAPATIPRAITDCWLKWSNRRRTIFVSLLPLWGCSMRLTRSTIW